MPDLSRNGIVCQVVRRRCGLIALALCVMLVISDGTGCSSTGGGSGNSKVYSWKPQAATQPRARSGAASRPARVVSTQAGADVLEESHRAASATWIAVPSPDGKKTVWVQVK